MKNVMISSYSIYLYMQYVYDIYLYIQGYEVYTGIHHTILVDRQTTSFIDYSIEAGILLGLYLYIL
jgi:hypothetical protein